MRNPQPNDLKNRFLETLYSILIAYNIVNSKLDLPDPSTFCSCVQTARLFDENVPLKNAIDIQPNYWKPEEGDFILLKYGDGVEKHHIARQAVVTAKRIKLYEGNFEECEFTERWISRDDPAIRGYYKTNPLLAISGV